MTLMRSLRATSAGRAVVLIRIVVGGVFLTEGIQKFLFPEALGAGRFAHIGIPEPQVLGPFVGVVEIACGGLVMLGLLTRLAAIPLLINITVAIISTKIPILLGRGFGPFAAPKPPFGVWGMLHEARTDFAMWLGLVFLLIVGGGRWSLDAIWTSCTRTEAPPGRSQPAA